jgi:protein PhnA
MSLESDLIARCGSLCDLCSSGTPLTVYEVPPKSGRAADNCVMVCETCRSQIEDPTATKADHWRCLNDSMWSPIPAIQVVAWRMLDRLKSEGWPMDLLESLYLEEDILTWARSTGSAAPLDEDTPEITVDSNGTVLNAGDSVTLIKDLVVKGGGFTAKRGTLVKNIALTSNPKHVEGRVNGTVIVLVAAFLKKAN